jgi:hypothetical protein
VSLEIFLAIISQDHTFIKSNRSHACDLAVFASLISRYYPIDSSKMTSDFDEVLNVNRPFFKFD